MVNRSFSGVFVLVGRDWKFGLETCAILIDHEINIHGIFGSSAELIFETLRTEDKIPQKFNSLEVISDARPWVEENRISKFLDVGLLGISAGFDFLVPEWLLKKNPAINLHPSYLPFNRGSHQTFWAIMEGTALGGSIHWMDSNFDTGPIIARQRVEDDGFQTSETLQTKSKDTCLSLLRAHIESILNGSREETTSEEVGSGHIKEQIFEKSTILDVDSVTGIELWNLIRATKHSDNGFYLRISNKLIKIECKITFP